MEHMELYYQIYFYKKKFSAKESEHIFLLERKYMSNSRSSFRRAVKM